MQLIKNKYIQFSLVIIIGLLIGIAIPKSGNMDTPSNFEESHDHQGLWSCSMHPQIVSETPGSCPICGMDLSPMEENSHNLDPNALVLTDDAAKAAQVSTYKITAAKSNYQTIEVSGALIPNLDKQFSEISYVSGRVDFLAHPSSGTKLKKGSLIAKLYSPELISAQQELISLSKLNDKNKHLNDAVIQKFKNWNFTDDQIQSVVNSNTIQQSFPIYAQQTGTITAVNVKQGDWIKAGQKLFTAVNLSTIWAELEVYESDINQFKKGQKIELIIEALSNQKRTATINFIDPIMNTDKRITKIRASISNNDNQLKPGMFVKASAKTSNNTPSIQIPASSVLWTGKQSLVYIKSPTAPTYTIRVVEIIEKQGDWYSISSGLEVGEEIVQSGTFAVDAAAQLSGKTSMINQ